MAEAIPLYRGRSPTASGCGGHARTDIPEVAEQPCDGLPGCGETAEAIPLLERALAVGAGAGH